ncbi:MAG: Hpt domain-containing protein [Moraxellaceae bacterium]|nr:Hpt domain-containing protein [Moraxellaceae bacterium]
MTGHYLDEGLLEELRGILEEEFPKLIATYVNDSTVRVADIQREFADGNAEALRRSVHSLKGASANLGLVYLVDVCQRLEEAARSGSLAGQSALVTEIQQEQHRALQLLRERQ